MIVKSYDFENIKDRVQAAECLQLSGQAEDCKRILENMARDILENETT